MGHQFKNVASRNKKNQILIFEISRYLGSHIVELSCETIATKSKILFMWHFLTKVSHITRIFLLRDTVFLK